MEKEGLRKDVVNIAVKICYSGVDTPNKCAAIAVGQADMVSCCFASLLAYYLGQRGYNRIEVVGYTGETMARAQGGSVGTVAIKEKKRGTMRARKTMNLRIINLTGGICSSLCGVRAGCLTTPASRSRLARKGKQGGGRNSHLSCLLGRAEKPIPRVDASVVDDACRVVPVSTAASWFRILQRWKS